MTDKKSKFNHLIDFDLLSEDPVVVDAGVCKGMFIEFLRSNNKTRDSRVIGFEPSKTNMDVINAKSLGNTEIYSMALVGDSSKKFVKFNEYKDHPGWGSILDRHTAGPLIKRLGHRVKTYKVEAVGINDIFELFNIDRIDFLKLDVEGAEYGIVGNMSIETAEKIHQMSIELHEKPDIERNMTRLSKSMVKALNKLGFKCKYFENGHEVWSVRKEIL